MTQKLDSIKAGDSVTVYDNFNGKANQVYATWTVKKVTPSFIICSGNYGDEYKFNKKNQGRIVGYVWPQICQTLES